VIGREGDWLTKDLRDEKGGELVNVSKELSHSRRRVSKEGWKKKCQ
jgi:hypothetical protein